MNLLKVGEWVALTELVKQYFIKAGYSKTEVNSLTQIKDIYQYLDIRSLHDWTICITLH